MLKLVTRIRKRLAVLSSALVFSIPMVAGAAETSQVVIEFQYTGDVQQWTVPTSGTYRLEVWGTEGGKNITLGDPDDLGGKGGYAAGEVTLRAGEQLYIYVGGKGENGREGANYGLGGWNGGGNGSAHPYTNYGVAGGGGSSYIAGLANPVTEAGIHIGHGLARITLVSELQADLINITISERSIRLPIGTAMQLQITAHYSDGTTRNITNQATYKSSNTSVLTINSSGSIAAIGAGSSDISVNYKEKTRTGVTKAVLARVKGVIY